MGREGTQEEGKGWRNEGGRKEEEEGRREGKGKRKAEEGQGRVGLRGRRRETAPRPLSWAEASWGGNVDMGEVHIRLLGLGGSGPCCTDPIFPSPRCPTAAFFFFLSPIAGETVLTELS